MNLFCLGASFRLRLSVCLTWFSSLLFPPPSPLAFVCLCSALFHLPLRGSYEFMCLVDSEAVNLVIHNRYLPRLFPFFSLFFSPTDKNGTFSSSMSVKGCTFLARFVLGPGILLLVLIASVRMRWALTSTQLFIAPANAPSDLAGVVFSSGRENLSCWSTQSRRTPNYSTHTFHYSGGNCTCGALNTHRFLSFLDRMRPYYELDCVKNAYLEHCSSVQSGRPTYRSAARLLMLIMRLIWPIGTEKIVFFKRKGFLGGLVYLMPSSQI